ncbi:photosystem II reaction center PsbP family protein [Anabaena cylindrica FACHB-243]|uniref:Photosystem II oxygen evolving complex protein PsbP n=1 Tax=Anabaena cylindrica (strain ATCC 27899 / PCC 7122) TaxID=272123 RepID=K9ZKX3_ANACC|nr:MULTISPECIES: photosystem II reaction center PsbP [Anabaena]AFZ59846.1 photosystem II oxygen evolving complex protein PsbP [Anabaena cylindrica PCC 7122]MBD2417245.1 photosystem II reaction center PsbP family protein [Anabaena cylindrica FACHB-243]MBY5280410.1 photosystem II oxygen evolving complex protein PsbP [Anabaena sp. CCAP 1446/1C]MBY5311660.1 photosystem II oxygen evolving complex protein PsbP [Anabaena sp. CCAP 1446/1C]MCM2404938.1 photosystem II reaction center PsbP family protein
MWKKIALIFLLVFSFSFSNSDVAAAAGFKSFVDSADGYQFLYPNGWLQVKVANGPDVVFHDLIEISENVSVVISPVPAGKNLAELGTPTEVGYKLGKAALAPVDSGRKAELTNAVQKESNGKIYYLLEYEVQLPNGQQRHNISSVAVSRGKLFTFNASVPERRWQKLQRMIDEIVNSFTVY